MKKMIPHITLKSISIIMLSMIFIITAVQVISLYSIKSDILNIQTMWDEVNIEQAKKRQMSYSIQRFLGFNGMVHKLNTSLANKDSSLVASAKNDMQSINTIIQLYLSLPLSAAERYALHDIASVLTQYQNNSDNLLALFEQNAPPTQLLAQLDIDVTIALQGVEILKQYNRSPFIPYKSNHTLSTDKRMLLADLLSQLGFGGLIHDSKHWTSIDDHLNSSQPYMTQLFAIINQYQESDLNDDEKQALQNMMRGIDLYQQQLQKQPTSPASLSVATALLEQGIQVLEKHIQAQRTKKIYHVGKKIHAIESNMETLIAVIVCFSLAALLLFTYFMFTKVITPLQSITEEMIILARQRYNKDGRFRYYFVYEIRQIARAIRIFKRNENKRRSASKSLAAINQHTLQQLDEINDLQDRSEQKTEQALTLANHLIKLQEAADNDRNNALNNQRRINTILNTVHDAIITTNDKAIIETVNTITEIMLGYNENELIGKSIMHIMPEDMVNMHHKIMHNLHSNAPPELPKRCHEQFIKRADGSLLPAEIFMGQSTFNDQVSYTVVIRDITRRKKDEEEIQKLILTDPLTNLANRRHFNQDLQRSMDNTVRLNLRVALLMIDLDNFKPVNDTYGHNAGDKVLQEVAKRLSDVTRSVDLIARLGGDEFAIILNSLSDCFDPITPAQKVIDSLKQPMHIDGETITIGGTVGIAISNAAIADKETFMNQADKALYKAKGLGKGVFFLYDDLDEDEK